MRFILAAFALATIAGVLPAQQRTPPAGQPDSAGPRDTTASRQWVCGPRFGPTLADTCTARPQLSGGRAAPGAFAGRARDRDTTFTDTLRLTRDQAVARHGPQSADHGRPRADVRGPRATGAGRLDPGSRRRGIDHQPGRCAAPTSRSVRPSTSRSRTSSDCSTTLERPASGPPNTTTRRCGSRSPRRRRRPTTPCEWRFATAAT